VRRSQALRRAPGLGECAQHCERLEIDTGDADARLLAGEDVALDELAVGDDEQNAPNGLPGLLVGGLVQQLPVEHGLLERDRQGFLCAKLDCVRELLRVIDAAISKVRTPMRLLAMPSRMPSSAACASQTFP